METPLPTGDILRLFSIPPQMLSSFKCIIWLALAAIAEIPPVVCAFLAVGRYSAHPFADLPSLEFEWCVGVSSIQTPVHGPWLIVLPVTSQMFGMKYGSTLLFVLVGG